MAKTRIVLTATCLALFAGIQSLQAAEAPLEARVKRLEQQMQTLEKYLEKMTKEIEDPKVSEDLRGLLKELGAMVHEMRKIPTPPVRPTEGTLIVENLTGLTQSLTVNGVAYAIAPGRTDMKVPFGDVQTQLALFEAPKKWTEKNWKQGKTGPELVVSIRY